MKRTLLLIAAAALFAGAASAQVPVTPNPDHEAMLRHADPKLAANKRFVYDCSSISSRKSASPRQSMRA